LQQPSFLRADLQLVIDLLVTMQRIHLTRRIIMKITPTLCLASALMSNSALFAGALPVSDSGLITVFPGQTAQLNVVNLGDPATSCQLTLSFIDADGHTLPTPLLATLPGGASTSFTVPSPIAAAPLRAHIDYSPQLIAQAGLKEPLAGCYNLVPTLEVLDATSTRLIISNFVGMPSHLPGENMKNVTICHKPDKPAEHTLSIPTAALKGHLGHGDSLGFCM
jgi:hypothetical protein